LVVLLRAVAAEALLKNRKQRARGRALRMHCVGVFVLDFNVETGVAACWLERARDIAAAHIKQQAKKQQIEKARALFCV
jgi:hypothetical protein